MRTAVLYYLSLLTFAVSTSAASLDVNIALSAIVNNTLTLTSKSYNSAVNEKTSIDLENDGVVESVSIKNNTLTVSDASGKTRAGFPLQLTNPSITGQLQLLVKDINNDNNKEILVSGTLNTPNGNAIYLGILTPQGSFLTGWPKLIYSEAGYSSILGNGQLLPVDIDGNGTQKLMLNTHSSRMSIYTIDGRFSRFIDAGSAFKSSIPLTWVDSNQDNKKEVLSIGCLQNNQVAISLVDSSGQAINGWPKEVLSTTNTAVDCTALTQPYAVKITFNGTAPVFTAQTTAPLSSPVALIGAYKQIYLRGTHNNWATNTLMALVANNVWEYTALFGNTASERFKFDINGDWLLNFGDSNKDGIADASGADIFVAQGAGSYLIRFNDSTKIYSYNKITSPNLPPTANAGPDQTLQASTSTASITLDGRASADTDGTISSYAWDEWNGSSWQTAGTGALLTLPSVAIGQHRYRLTVTDNKTATSNDEVIITVTEKQGFDKVYSKVYLRGTHNNWATTVLMTLVANNSWEGKATFGGTSSERFKFDINGDWTLNFGDSNKDGIADNAGADILITQGAGDYLIKFNDATKAYSSVKVTPSNLPPVANAGPDQNIQTSSSTANITLDGRASTDADGTITSYAWEEFNGTTWTVVGSGAQLTLPVVTIGQHRYRLTVTDNNTAKASDETLVTITSQSVNQMPIADAGADQNLLFNPNINNSIILNGSGSRDPDGTITSYLWEEFNGSAWQAVGNTVSLTLSNVSIAQHRYRLTVTDNQSAKVSDEVLVNIVAHLPPTADAGADQEIVSTVDAWVNLDGSTSSTPNGSISSYSWRVNDGSLSGSVFASVAKPSYFCKVGVPYLFTLLVKDDKGWEASDSVSVIVSPTQTNKPPIAQAGVDQVIQSNTPVNITLDGRASTDSNGSITRYTWQQYVGSNLGQELWQDVGYTALITIEKLNLGQYRYRLMVKDNQGATGIDEVLITVKPTQANLPPVADAGVNTRNIKAGESIAFSGAASRDVDGSIVRYQWKKQSVLGGQEETSESISPTFTFNNQGDFTVSLTVTDNTLNQHTALVAVNVSRSCSICSKNNEVVYLRGGSWGWDATSRKPMQLIGYNLWATQADFYNSPNFKFDVHKTKQADWSLGFGDGRGYASPNLGLPDNQKQAPTGIAKQDLLSGGVWTRYDDILAPTSGSFTINFDENTRRYSLTPIQNAGTIKRYPQVFLRGTHNNWQTTPMTQTGDYLWQAEVSFALDTNQRFKFDIYGDWTTALGDTNKDGVAEVGGADINITTGKGLYRIQFDDAAYTYKIIKQADTPANKSPVANAGADQTILSFTPPTITLNGSASTDADGSIKNYYWDEYINDVWQPVGFGSIISLYNISLNPHRYRLTVLDNQSASHTDEVLVSIADPAKIAQTITFPVIADQTYLSAAPSLQASATSGNTITFSSATPNQCTISNDKTVNLMDTGICTITANAEGDRIYLAASPVSRSFQIKPSAQIITFSALQDKWLENIPFDIQATASSNLEVTFTSSTPTICSVQGVSVKTLALGTCTIAANQAGNTRYLAAPAVTQSFKITPIVKEPQAISFATPPDRNLNETVSVARLASSSSLLPISYTSKTPVVCTVDATATVTLITTGICTIEANQIGNAYYFAASPVAQSFMVVPVGAPFARIMRPSADTVIGTSDTLEMLSDASTNSGTITRVEFFDGQKSIGYYSSIDDLPSQIKVILPFKSKEIAIHPITVKVTNSAGMTTTSLPVNVRVVAPIIESYESYYVGVSDIDFTLNPPAAANGASVSKIEVLKYGTLLGSTTTAPYTFQWKNAPIGDHQVSAKVTYSDGKTITSSPLNITVSETPSINFTAGLGLSEQLNVVQLLGTIKAPINSSVEVNGYYATVTQDGQFFINNFPLELGSNTLTATLRTIQGVTATTSITMSSVGTAQFSVVMDHETELGSEFSTYATITANTAKTYSRVEITCGANAVPNSYTPEQATTDGRVGCRYTTAGTRTITFKFYAKAADGSEQLVQIETQKVTLVSPVILDKMLLGVYGELMAKFRANNATQAGNLFLPEVRSKYTEIFSKISDLPNMANTFGTIASDSITEDLAEYIIFRQKNGIRYGYPVYFMPGQDGIWRITGM